MFLCLSFIDPCFLTCLLLFDCQFFFVFFFIVVFGNLRDLNWGLITPEKVSFASASDRVCYVPGNTSAPLQYPKPLFLIRLRAGDSHQDDPLKKIFFFISAYCILFLLWYQFTCLFVLL